MSGALARLASWLVEPAVAAPPRARRAGTRGAPGRARPRRRGAPAQSDVALLTSGGSEARALGAGLALRATGGVAALGVWTGDDRPSPPAPVALRTPGARRLAASLVARGMEATAAGRLVTVALPAGEADSAAAARRLLAARVPVVLAVAGPRAGAWDDLLRELALVLVHAPDAALQALTLARLAEQDVVAAPLGATPGLLARSLARAGLALPGGPAIPETAG